MSWLTRIFGGRAATAEVVEAEAEKAAPGQSASPMRTLGTGGTAVYGGYISERETNADLVGVAKWKTYANFTLNLPIVGASIRFWDALLGLSEWDYEPTPEAAGREADEVADFYRGVFEDLATPWPQVMGALGLYKYRGHSIAEWTAKRRADGAIGLLDVRARPQHTIQRWEMLEDGTVAGVYQQSPISMREIFLPRWKLAYAVDAALSDTPDGVGLLRHAVAAAKRLVRYEQLEGWGFELDMRGVPVCRVPLDAIDKDPDLDDAKKKEKIDPFEKIIANHVRGPAQGYMIDSVTYQNGDGTPSTVPMYAIELLKGEGAGQDPIARAINRVEHQIARIFGTQFLMLGADGKGSLALSSNMLMAVTMMANASLRDLRHVVRKDLIEPLGRLNGFDPALLPKPKTSKIQLRDVADLAGMMRDLGAAVSQLGAGPVNDVLRNAGVSEVDESRLDELDASLRAGRDADEPPDGDEDLEDAARDRAGRKEKP